MEFSIKFLSKSAFALFVLHLQITPSFASDAYETHDFKTHNNFVTSSSVHELRDFENALAEWGTKLGEDKTVMPSMVRPSGNGYRLEIKELLPKMFKDLILRSQKSGEANCYNTALVSNKVISTLRFTSPSEFGFYMKSPLCRKLTYEEKNLPGDIIEFKGGHAAVFLTEKIIFNKVSNDISSPWRFEHMNHAFRDFKEFKKCSSSEGDVCGMVDIFRCESLENYLSKANPNKALVFIDKALNEVEAAYQKETLRKARIKKDKIDLWESELANLENDLLELGSFSYETEYLDSKFYFNSIYYRVRLLRMALIGRFPI
jgi:hypothetical protein